MPGYVPGFLQPIENRILMISTGIRAQVGVKILGDNLDALQDKAFEVENASCSEVPRRDRRRAVARAGKTVSRNRSGSRSHGALRTARAGCARCRRGGHRRQERHDHHRRPRSVFRSRCGLQRSERDDHRHDSATCWLRRPAGRYIPLGQVAKSSASIGPSEIASENGRLRVFVQANVQDRDLGGFVEEVKARIAQEIVRIAEGNDHRIQRPISRTRSAPQRTLRIIVPTVLFIIFLLLYIVYRNVKEAAHVILAVPFALTGGVFLQYLLGYNFSVAVWVGYIALFGTAIQTGVVMVVYLEEALERKRRRTRRRIQPRRSDQRDQGRRASSPAAESHDRRHHRRQPAADHVEHAHRRRSHEAARHAGHRRDDQQPASHSDCHAGDLCLVARAGIRAICDDQFIGLIVREQRGAALTIEQFVCRKEGSTSVKVRPYETDSGNVAGGRRAISDDALDGRVAGGTGRFR